ncbi:hypothetical protein AX774_g1560 [Zancudomyces culisetae]|uniref:Uncharacterized protein n=1 Tax=Zancudomyces culisetae TaxID=1213189 RepID=A0A1R1PVA1_ZANCU|nr:hypothetical protein AX774_g1560 [Zancudomyces culisetae]|eukprot:OMH84905.1 hypothetical protein AX774_g1560 [Zancudomyces culisetae]
MTRLLYKSLPQQSLVPKVGVVTFKQTQYITFFLGLDTECLFTDLNHVQHHLDISINEIDSLRNSEIRVSIL